MRPFGAIVRIHEDDGQHEFVALVERVEDLVAGDGDGVRPLDAALDLDVLRVGCSFGGGSSTGPSRTFGRDIDDAVPLGFLGLR